MKSSLPVSLRLVRVLESTDKVPWKGAVEVLLTNVTAKPIRIPVGVDHDELLKPPASQRRYLSFTIWIGGDKPDNDVGSSRAAANGEHSETTLELRPGDSVTFKLPFDKRRAGLEITKRGRAPDLLTASVDLNRMETDKDGDCSEGMSLQVKSENSLKWITPSNLSGE